MARAVGRKGGALFAHLDGMKGVSADTTWGLGTQPLLLPCLRPSGCTSIHYHFGDSLRKY